MPNLLLGPVLRYVDETSATIWIQTDVACEITVLGRTARTFRAGDYHFALVVLEGLEPGTTTPYTVDLDGERRWPLDDSPYPPSVIRTIDPASEQHLLFGSCRVDAPHEEPYTLSRQADEAGREVDALRAIAERLTTRDPASWPDQLLLLGDQVYADEVSERALAFIRARRDTSQPPGEEIADFDEYVQLYLGSWSEPLIRWMLSTIPSQMIFDDHDVRDDWNISEEWLTEMRAEPWWDKRITGGLASYWIYQHLGNLSPADLREDPIYPQLEQSEDDVLDDLLAFARRADREAQVARWSFSRDLGDVRILTIDSRATRVLEDGHRAMLDDREWRWVEERLSGGPRHIVIASSLPVLLGQGLHFGEAWSEALCAGAWGPVWARLGEKLRRAADLEHWAAFTESFARLMARIGEVAAGQHGPAPASITIVSGDVHHAYLTEVAYRRSVGTTSQVWQAVCSPFRNPLSPAEQRVIRFGQSRTGHALARALARGAGVPDPDVRWRMVRGPYFDNQVASLRFRGESAEMALERIGPVRREGADPELEVCFTAPLA